LDKKEDSKASEAQNVKSLADNSKPVFDKNSPIKEVNESNVFSETQISTQNIYNEINQDTKKKQDAIQNTGDLVDCCKPVSVKNSEEIKAKQSSTVSKPQEFNKIADGQAKPDDSIKEIIDKYSPQKKENLLAIILPQKSDENLDSQANYDIRIKEIIERTSPLKKVKENSSVSKPQESNKNLDSQAKSDVSIKHL